MEAEVRHRIRPTYGKDKVEIVTDDDCEFINDNGRCFVVRKATAQCVDNRFKVIKRAKEHLLKATNIDSSPNEMEVLDNILFRCWQMGWLKQYEL